MTFIMGKFSTGVEVNVGGKSYGMHEDCFRDFDRDVKDSGVRVVAMGPLFADEGEWACAYRRCHKGQGCEK